MVRETQISFSIIYPSSAINRVQCLLEESWLLVWLGTNTCLSYKFFQTWTWVLSKYILSPDGPTRLLPWLLARLTPLRNMQEGLCYSLSLVTWAWNHRVRQSSVLHTGLALPSDCAWLVPRSKGTPLAWKGLCYKSQWTHFQLDSLQESSLDLAECMELILQSLC